MISHGHDGLDKEVMGLSWSKKGSGKQRLLQEVMQSQSLEVFKNKLDNEVSGMT